MRLTGCISGRTVVSYEADELLLVLTPPSDANPVRATKGAFEGWVGWPGHHSICTVEVFTEVLREKNMCFYHVKSYIII